MKTKTFDCVEMKHRGSLEIYQTVKDMTVEQELQYWRDKTEKLRTRLDLLQQHEKKTRHTA